jgi:virulence-associated protein VapD
MSLYSPFVSEKRRKAQREWMRKRNREERKGFSLLQGEIYLKEELTALERLQEIQPLTGEDKKSP